jgi:hypothetical protein
VAIYLSRQPPLDYVPEGLEKRIRG